MNTEPATATDPGALADSRTLVQTLRQALSAQLIETHISWVLLAGDTAWKIKKPVRLGFLDFGTLAQRRFFCEEELRLNRRYAPSMYRDVLPITGTPQAPRLGGEGPAIEYALRMVRFAPRALLSEQLADGTLQPAHLDALALRLAALHAGAQTAPVDCRWGSGQEVSDEAHAVLRRLQDLGVEVNDLQGWLAEQRPRLMTQWGQRRSAGHVRECHGDLHLRNTVVLAEGVTAFDGIEFDPALRWIDVCSDMAFLAMDLMAHDHSGLAWRFINAWLDATGDHGSVTVLRFYLAYRALVRALVGHLTPAATQGPSGATYLALARRLALAPLAPRLLLTHGLSGSGKTTLTQQLLEHTGALRLRSDVERKRLFGLAALDPSVSQLPGGIYGADTTRRTYDQLIERARLLLRAGYPVIVDAASLRRDERQRMQSLAFELHLPFTLLDCQAELEVLRQRVQARQTRHDDASEADEQVLAQQLTFREPLDAQEQAHTLSVDTAGPLDVAALAARWQQAPQRSM